MPGRRVSHSESRWVQLPHTVIRCNGTLQSGKRCRREAIEGSVVCEVHGGLAPQVRRRAAERLLVTADEAIQVIMSFISDPTVPAGVRLKAAQDIADRAGLAGVQMHQIIPVEEDPLERFFNDMGPDAWITRGPDGREYTQDQLLARAFPESANQIESGQSNESDSVLTAEEYQRLWGDDEPETILDAEIVDEPELEAVNGDDSPARIRQMIQDRAFDRKPGQ
jgi:hypothetical protein